MYYYERKKEIFEFLLQKRCCLRCCLRFCGVVTTPAFSLPQLFENPELTSKRLGYLTDDVKFDSKSICTVCLGILQNDSIDSAIEKIVTTCQSIYKDVNLFTCALTTPVSMLIKEHVVQMTVIKEFKIIDDDVQNYKRSLQTLKDVWRWCAYPKLQEKLKFKAGYAACNGFNNCIGCIKCISSLTIDVCFLYKDDENECKILEDHLKNTNKLKNFYSRNRIENFLNENTNEGFVLDSLLISLKVPENRAELDKVQCTHDSIFIGGRYTKLSRKLSQTPWHINGEKKMESSVQDVIFDSIFKHIDVELMKFLSSGREDVDVRMLYNGRPFAVELINPKSPKITSSILSKIVTDVNTSKDVQIVSEMHVLTRENLKKLKEGENEKTKNYRAVCIYKSQNRDPNLLEKLNSMEEFEVVQKTPIRVLHRRPLVARYRKIHTIKARWIKDFGDEISSNFLKLSANLDDIFILDLQTQAGTYVKEFVHGDFGRTKPSLCDLLQANVDIAALDVTGINLFWP